MGGAFAGPWRRRSRGSRRRQPRVRRRVVEPAVRGDPRAPRAGVLGVLRRVGLRRQWCVPDVCGNPAGTRARGGRADAVRARPTRRRRDLRRGVGRRHRVPHRGLRARSGRHRVADGPQRWPVDHNGLGAPDRRSGGPLGRGRPGRGRAGDRAGVHIGADRDHASVPRPDLDSGTVTACRRSGSESSVQAGGWGVRCARPWRSTTTSSSLPLSTPAPSVRPGTGSPSPAICDRLPTPGVEVVVDFTARRGGSCHPAMAGDARRSRSRRYDGFHRCRHRHLSQRVQRQQLRHRCRTSRSVLC